jgi:ribosomal protein L37AE/L43A
LGIRAFSGLYAFRKLGACKIFSDRLEYRSVKTATTRGKVMENDQPELKVDASLDDLRKKVRLQQMQDKMYAQTPEDNQPDSSKREDSSHVCCRCNANMENREHLRMGVKWLCRFCGMVINQGDSDEMRYSEH